MPKGLIRAVGALLTALALYSLLGFLILPGIALRIANQQLANYATVPSRIERIELNPFSLELTLWGLKIGEPGKEQVGFERLYANLQIDSLWTRALHLADVQLDKPKTELLFDKSGQLNLAQLFKLPPSEPTPTDPDAKPFPLRIDSIKLAGGNVHFQDLRPSEPIEFLYDELDFELKNLSTLPDDNADMTLVTAGPEGGQIDWKGNFSLVPITSEGTLKVTDGKMKAWWPYVRDALPLVLEDGVLNFSTDYKFSLAKETELNLTNTAASIAPFAIKAPDGRPLARLERLDVSAGNHNPIAAFHLYGDTVAKRITDRIREAQVEHQRSALDLGTVADTVDHQHLAKPVGHTGHHIPDQLAVQTVQRLGTLGLIAARNGDLVLLQTHVDIAAGLQTEGSLRPLGSDVVARDSDGNALRHGHRHHPYPRHTPTIPCRSTRHRTCAPAPCDR